MITNTENTLSKGSENFDYTEWQRNYFDNILPEELEADTSKYFETHQNSFPNAVKL